MLINDGGTRPQKPASCCAAPSHAWGVRRWRTTVISSFDVVRNIVGAAGESVITVTGD